MSVPADRVRQEPLTSHSAVPRLAVAAAAVLIVLTLLATAGSRITGLGTTQLAPSTAVDTRALRFSDRDDGAVVVVDARLGSTVEVLEPGTNGFLRGVLRGLARERRLAGIGQEPAFLLTRWADGRLSLQDPSTGRVINLEAFGPTNAGVFVRLLGPAGDTSPSPAAAP